MTDLKRSYNFKLFRDENGNLYENPIPISVEQEIVGVEEFRTHRVTEEYGIDYNHALLSEFIADLTAIYEKYGDGYISTNNEMTPELFGKITVRNKEITGLPCMEGKTHSIRYFDIDEIIR